MRAPPRTITGLRAAGRLDLPAIEERQPEREPGRDAGEDHRRDDLQRPLEVHAQLVERDRVPLGSGQVAGGGSAGDSSGAPCWATTASAIAANASAVTAALWAACAGQIGAARLAASSGDSVHFGV